MNEILIALPPLLLAMVVGYFAGLLRANTSADNRTHQFRLERDSIAEKLEDVKRELFHAKFMAAHWRDEWLKVVGANSRPSSKTDKGHWRSVLGLGSGRVGKAEITAAYLKMAKKHHPDRGGDPRIMQQINAARDQALREVA